jgi:hypothetical protein
MPVAATGLADVRTRDPQPLVIGRGSQHPFQQLVVAGLELGALPQLAPRIADPCGQRVADRLQVAQAQRPRLVRDRRHPGVDPEAWEGIGEE